MTAGAGIIHSEGPAEKIQDEGGTVQLLQLWINLPADKKQLPAAFRHYAGTTLPVIENEQYWLKVVIGDYQGQASPISTYTPMFLYHLKMKKGALVTIPVKETHSAAMYIMEGKIKVLNREPIAGELVNFAIDGNQLAFTAAADAEILLFGGEPIKEKVVNYGPFVMNSFEEIQQAIGNYETGKMGVLEY